MNDEHSRKCPFKDLPTLDWSQVKVQVMHVTGIKFSLKLILMCNTHFLTCLFILNIHES